MLIPGLTPRSPECSEPRQGLRTCILTRVSDACALGSCENPASGSVPWDRWSRQPAQDGDARSVVPGAASTSEDLLPMHFVRPHTRAAE